MEKVTGLKVGIKVKGFHDAKRWLERLVGAGVAQCASCPNPATHIFWQDETEWYCHCETCREYGPQWTGSTRWNPDFFSKIVIPDQFWAWAKTLSPEERKRIKTLEFDATDYRQYLPEDYYMGGEQITLHKSIDGGIHIYINVYEMNNGLYAYTLIRDFGRTCFHYDLTAPFETVEACVTDAKNNAKEGNWNGVG